jgi:galactokinase
LALDTEALIARFRTAFPGNEAVRIYRAPGRVNVIGEHTDYNEGFVLPVAIDLSCYAVAGYREGDEIEAFAFDLNEKACIPISGLGSRTPTGTWMDYVTGVAQQLLLSGFGPRSARILLSSSIPAGAGLSSSAALEVVSALALASEPGPKPEEVARLCHDAETKFVGLPCGIMDQYVSVFGRAGHALLIDCRSRELRPVRLPEDLTLVAVNSNVSHSLRETAYVARVQECRQAVEAVQVLYPQVTSLRDVAPEMLGLVEGDPRRRARHVISENRRVMEFVQAAESNDRQWMGQLMRESHESLRLDYQVSCPELDFLVDTALTLPGVFGARMTGGGFGGCTVNLLGPEAKEEFSARIQEAYFHRYGREAAVYVCQPSQGAERIL